MDQERINQIMENLDKAEKAVLEARGFLYDIHKDLGCLKKTTSKINSQDSSPQVNK